MNCLKCKQKVYYDVFCRKHFIENIEKRVKRDIRINSLIKKNEKLIIKDPLSRYFIKEIISLPVKIGKSGRPVIMWTMDDKILEFLTALFAGKQLKKSAKNKIKLFRTVKDKELEAYARLKKIRFSRKRSKEEKRILAELDKLEKDHKETRFSLFKSIEEINRLK